MGHDDPDSIQGTRRGVQDVTNLGDFTPASGGRIVDMGGLDPDLEDEDYDYDGPNLVMFGLDPGITTGWSALKVPVGRLLAVGATRTLSRCRWAHGQIQRSAIGDTGSLAQSASDSAHVDQIFRHVAHIYESFVSDPAEEDEWEADVFVYVMEHFSLRMLSMDTNLLAPVRVEEKFLDRLWVKGITTPIFLQSPSDAKRVATDDRLKSWGMYDRASGPHARDADRHNILFLRKFSDDAGLRSSLGFPQ